VTYSQHIVEEFYIHKGENVFHLQMPASEIRRILGTPLEEKKVIREHYHRPNYYVIKYSGIEFTYFDFHNTPEVMPVIVVITFKEPFQISNIDVIGRNKNEILNQYGNDAILQIESEYTYIRYTFRLQTPHHLVLQFRFNFFGICDEVSLIHSHFYI
jgi:hypothetical protein